MCSTYRHSYIDIFYFSRQPTYFESVFQWNFLWWTGWNCRLEIQRHRHLVQYFVYGNYIFLSQRMSCHKSIISSWNDIPIFGKCEELCSWYCIIYCVMRNLQILVHILRVPYMRSSKINLTDGIEINMFQIKYSHRVTHLHYRGDLVGPIHYRRDSTLLQTCDNVFAT